MRTALIDSSSSHRRGLASDPIHERKETIGMFDRISRRVLAGGAALLLAASGVTGVAIARSGSGGSERPGAESNAPENSAKDSDNVQYTAPGDADYKGGPKAKQQSGGETGNEKPNNDGPGGHADEPGNPNANHQFQGNE
jgi:hypothetical protein